MDNSNFLEKLADSFDDLKERLIRIEENVKDVPGIRADVDKLKVDIAQNREATKSGHKRIDAMEKAAEEKEKEIKWLKRQIIVGGITFFFTVAGSIITYIVTTHK